MQQLLQHNLHHAKQQMKEQADKRRSDRTFLVGDQVFVKLQPYVQSSVARRANHKLAFRYFGPYQIRRSINPVAYEVALPSTSKIHPVFHVSQLRKALFPGTPVSSNLPVVADIPVTPVKIIAHRWKKGPHGRKEQVQVQWSDPSVLDITWEDKLELQQRFPGAAAWGQAASQEEGDVRGSSTPTQEQSDMGLSSGPRRPTRLVQPNRKYLGDGWAT